MTKKEPIGEYLARMSADIEDKLIRLNVEEQDEFVVGLKTAYVEVLEILQKRQGDNGLDYDIEERYPIVITSKKKKVDTVSRCPF